MSDLFELTEYHACLAGDCDHTLMEARHINWQPIEGAPRDRLILIYEPEPPKGDFDVVAWHVAHEERKEGWWNWDCSLRYDPTHWCELQPPEGEKT